MSVRTPLVSGLVSITFRNLNPTEIIELVQRAELEVIEWGGDVHVPHGDLARARDVRARTRDAGLAVAAYGSYYRAAYSEQAQAEGHDAIEFMRVLETAVMLGAPAIRVWAGRQGSADAEAAGTRSRVVEDLVRIAELAAGAGVQVATEFHGGTLTDTNESARRLFFEEAIHPNLYSYWQPPVGMSEADCLAGLRAMAPKLSHLHVFQWSRREGGGTDAYPLSEGVGRWQEFLSVAAAAPATALTKQRAAMLEFVPGGTAESFLREARTLRGLLAAL
ncbi:hypothetical protein AXK11_01450 [Cephaloticoccus primus]|uniref:Xylose isomerase-like TIM barrel domain-containing protein n=1 Tax=Cephaloticoccus primus TaxID=1548207 RepID=A0A139STN5_9BACT|nr:TIM barrel protein [Cephaloticoccus primus]KXU37925.1 hypothetical protein AXK11_01450 [Cephaloticoccus primus]